MTLRRPMSRSGWREISAAAQKIPSPAFLAAGLTDNTTEKSGTATEFCSHAKNQGLSASVANLAEFEALQSHKAGEEKPGKNSTVAHPGVGGDGITRALCFFLGQKI